MEAVHVERLNTIIARIKANPTCWEQRYYHCETSHCIAGHAQIDSGNEPNITTAFVDGMKWLGLSVSGASYLFHKSRTLMEIKHFAQLKAV